MLQKRWFPPDLDMAQRPVPWACMRNARLGWSKLIMQSAAVVSVAVPACSMCTTAVPQPHIGSPHATQSSETSPSPQGNLVSHVLHHRCLYPALTADRAGPVPPYSEAGGLLASAGDSHSMVAANHCTLLCCDGYSVKIQQR